MARAPRDERRPLQVIHLRIDVLAALVAGIGLLVSRPTPIPLWAPVSQLALVAVVVVSTAMLEAGQHAALLTGFDERILTRLVRSNWLRVAAWSAAGVLAVWMCQRTFAP